MNSAEYSAVCEQLDHTGFQAMLRLMRLSIFNSSEAVARLTIKRLLVLVFVFPGFIVGMILHRLALFLDNVLFPGYRDIEVRQPVFIMGIPRSGTTYFHHLLSKDTHNFTTFKLWELMYAPAIIERKVWLAVGAFDRRLGGIGRKALIALEQRTFTALRAIHPVSLFEPEEDELVLLPYFASVFLLFAFPFPDRLRPLIRFDDEVPLHEQDRVMARYKACVQRHLYVHGPDKRFLSKSPLLSSKIGALKRTFPDATVVCNVRRPYEAIPSTISLVSILCNAFGSAPQQSKLRDMTLDIASYFYRNPMQRLPKWPAAEHAFLRYDDLTADPERAVLDLYARFGISVSDTFRAYLGTQHEVMRNHKSRHRYSLQQWELSPEHVYAEYRDVFHHFDFSVEYPC